MAYSMSATQGLSRRERLEEASFQLAKRNFPKFNDPVEDKKI